MIIKVSRDEMRHVKSHKSIRTVPYKFTFWKNIWEMDYFKHFSQTLLKYHRTSHIVYETVWKILKTDYAQFLFQYRTLYFLWYLHVCLKPITRVISKISVHALQIPVFIPWLKLWLCVGANNIDDNIGKKIVYIMTPDQQLTLQCSYTITKFNAYIYLFEISKQYNYETVVR